MLSFFHPCGDGSQVIMDPFMTGTHRTGFRTVDVDEPGKISLLFALFEMDGTVFRGIEPVVMGSWPDEPVSYTKRARLRMLLDVIASYLNAGGTTADLWEVARLLSSAKVPASLQPMAGARLFSIEAEHLVEMVFALPGGESYLRVVEDQFTEELTRDELLAGEENGWLDWEGTTGRANSSGSAVVVARKSGISSGRATNG